MTRTPLATVALAVGLWATWALPAQAQTSCADLPNPLYLQVGDTQEPLMKTLGRQLRKTKVKELQTTLVYVTTGSCTNIEAMYKGTPITLNPKYVPSEEEAPDWKTTDAAPTCVIASGGHEVEVANSALFVSACSDSAPPDGIKLFQGPNQAYAFAVPEASTQTAITAEEAYFVFGFGSAGMVEPWTDESFYFIRPTTKSTLLALAAAIHVPGKSWHAPDENKLDQSSQVVSALASSTEPEKSIGILGTEIYDRNRDKLSSLAFRAFGQKHAYFPDSKSTSFDKRNVRDGHYFPWSPTVWLTHVDGAGKPTNKNAENLINLILGNEIDPAPDFEPLASVVSVGLVPECAMSVTREKEGGDLSLYTPAEPCGCYFEKNVPEGSTKCTTCDSDNPCATGKCRHGYCEAK